MSFPFISRNFFEVLDQSEVIGGDSGWKPSFIFADDGGEKGMLYFYEKNHSYGEYIFDWAWAQAYARYGLDFYPKLTSMIPFSPLTTPHFLMQEFNDNLADKLLNQFEEKFLNSNVSSANFLFLTKRENDFFQEREYLMRESFQYHFYNKNFHCFNDFLSSLKVKKAKQIRKERVVDEKITIKSYTGRDLTEEHARQMFNFYASTISLKRAIRYLNESFFLKLFKAMPSNVLYIEANISEEAVAGAFYLYDKKTLYGRYWGAKYDIKNLHFELCYYQGIEFCIQKKLEKFEAGAQGEHKIKRGFEPTLTYSAHKIKDERFRPAVENFIKEEKIMVKKNMEHLAQYLPFK